jgi:hypothetical protein
METETHSARETRQAPSAIEAWIALKLNINPGSLVETCSEGIYMEYAHPDKKIKIISIDPVNLISNLGTPEQESTQNGYEKNEFDAFSTGFYGHNISRGSHPLKDFYEQGQAAREST